MPAGITERDGVFTVRRPAWWDVKGAHVLEDYPTREEAKRIAHNWEPVTEPLYRVVMERHHHGDPTGDDCDFGGDECTIEEHFSQKRVLKRVDDHDLVVRSDDRYGPEIGVKPKTRGLVTNEELYDVAEALMKGEGSGEVIFETGGSLHGGKKVWLLMRFTEPLKVAGRQGTETIPYYALQNANDGSGSFRGQATMVCIVCDNTAQMADLDATVRGTEFTFRHSANVSEKVEEAKVALEGWREGVAAFQRLSEHMVDIPITKEQRTLFVHEFIPMPQTTLISERVRDNVVKARTQMLSIFDSPTQDGIADTAWGLVQASIEYSQWYRRAKTNESRFQRAYLDRSRLTADAMVLAQEVAQA